MIAHNKETQASMTPEKALQFLKEGNERFLNNMRMNRDLKKQAMDTSKGQFPFATILSCIDSRVPVELVFDQGLGDVFSIRIAGNFINTDILGSMEFGCRLAGSKLILVMGHSNCGAIKGACENVDAYQNLSSLLNNVQPAIQAVKDHDGEIPRSNEDFMQKVAVKNVELAIQKIIEQSPSLKEMIEQNELLIKGAMYDVKSGIVTFMD